MENMTKYKEKQNIHEPENFKLDQHFYDQNIWLTNVLRTEVYQNVQSNDQYQTLKIPKICYYFSTKLQKEYKNIIALYQIFQKQNTCANFIKQCLCLEALISCLNKSCLYKRPDKIIYVAPSTEMLPASVTAL